MRVIEIEGGSGPAEALKIAERPDPVAGPGQVLIRVRAAGVNRPDLLQRSGGYPLPLAHPTSWALRSQARSQASARV